MFKVRVKVKVRVRVRVRVRVGIGGAAYLQLASPHLRCLDHICTLDMPGTTQGTHMVPMNRHL